MVPQSTPRPVRRLPDVRDLACGLTVAGLVVALAILVAGGAGGGMGNAFDRPYIRVAEHRTSLCDAVLDPIHPAVGTQHLRACHARF